MNARCAADVPDANETCARVGVALWNASVLRRLAGLVPDLAG